MGIVLAKSTPSRSQLLFLLLLWVVVCQKCRSILWWWFCQTDPTLVQLVGSLQPQGQLLLVRGLVDGRHSENVHIAGRTIIIIIIICSLQRGANFGLVDGGGLDHVGGAAQTEGNPQAVQANVGSNVQNARVVCLLHGS